MSEDGLMDEEVATILLMDEEGEEHLFELIAELEIEGEHYKVLVPLDEEEGDLEEEDVEVEVIIMKVLVDEEGEEFLCDIEDDEEWERVADAWQELMEGEGLL